MGDNTISGDKGSRDASPAGSENEGSTQRFKSDGGDVPARESLSIRRLFESGGRYRAWLLRLPNFLTFFRLGLVPVFVLLMLDPTPFMVGLAIAVFIVAAITDYVDGIIARSFGACSDFGKLLDPLVDKVLVMAALVMLVAQRSDVDGRPWVPGYMVVLVLAREIWVTGLRAVAASQGIIVEAKTVGKFKSGFQMIAIVLLLLHDQRVTIFGLDMTWQLIGLNLLFLSIIFSYWSAFEYTHAILLEEKESRGAPPK